MYAFYFTVCSSCLGIRPFQDLDEPLRSLLSIGKQSSNLIKTCQTPLQVYLGAVTPEGDAAAVSVETTVFAQELRSDKQYGVGGRPFRLLSLGSSLSFFPKCFVLSSLMGVFQMEAVSAEYLPYFLANSDRTESTIVQLRHPLQTVHPPNEALAGTRMELALMWSVQLRYASIACIDACHQGNAHWDLTHSVKKQFNYWNGPVILRTNKWWCQPA